jgi:hypothetical protein
MQRLVVLALGLALALSNAAVADDANPGYITNPVWMTAPPTAGLPTNYPEADYRGFVPLTCRVQGDILTSCHAVDTPPPPEFLQAAMYAAGAARIGPQDGSGRATDGRDVFLFIDFPLKPGDAPTPPNTPPHPYERLAGYSWTQTPSAGQFSRYYPTAADNAHMAGRATMDCLVGSEQGRIVCTVISETPTGAGFGDAAVMVARGFRCADHTSDGRKTAGGRVRINLTFNPAP